MRDCHAECVTLCRSANTKLPSNANLVLVAYGNILRIFHEVIAEYRIARNFLRLQFARFQGSIPNLESFTCDIFSFTRARHSGN